MRPSLLGQTIHLILKDLRREWRSKEILTTTVAFAVMLVVIFTFGFYQSDRSTALVFPGTLWVAIVFSGTLAIERSFAQEKESGSLRALALIPGTQFSLYLGKSLVNLLFMLIFECVLLPMLLLALGAPLLSADRMGPFLLGVFLGTVGFVALGTVVAAMLVHHRLREVLVPLLLYPLLVPLLIFGVKLTALLFEDPLKEQLVSDYLMYMGLFDGVLLILAPSLFRWVLSAIE